MSTTDLPLQLFLAKQLPEEIEIQRVPVWNHKEPQFYWKDAVGGYVTPREWDYIVRSVEENLTIEQSSLYWVKLHKEAEADANSGHWLDLKAVGMAPWQTRAEALKKVLK